jgi:mono/diheme cytochrome c family protein
LTRLVIILAAPALLHAQNSMLTRGAEIFRTSCAVAYCHGAEGTAGRAPQLAGRAFNARDLSNVIRGGKAGAGMPGFSQQLKSEDIEAVTQYVLSLSGSAGVGAAVLKSADAEMPPAVRKGRALFDAVRTGGCGRCHEIGDRGSPVGPDLRTPSHTHVVTASPVDEDPFPAVLIEQTPARVRVYDLSARLPVLRTFVAGQVRITLGSAWLHSTAVQDYSAAELEAIAAYLRWVP